MSAIAIFATTQIIPRPLRVARTSSASTSGGCVPAANTRSCVLGSLVGATDAGQVRQLAGASELVEPLRIARLADFDRRIDIDAR